MPTDELFRISESLDAVITQYKVLDKKIVVCPVENYQEVHEDLCGIIVKVIDENGDLILS